MTAVQKIIAQASQLSERERAEVAGHLLKTLPEPDYDVSDEDVVERRRQLEAGEVEEISLDQLKAGLGL